MKKLFFGLVIVGLYNLVSYADGIRVVQSPINGTGTPVTVSISSTTLTKVPTSQTSGRFGVNVSVPSPNTGIAGFMGDCSSTSLAITIRPIELSTGTGRVPYAYFPIREDVCLWFISLNTAVSGQNIHYQEVKQ